MQVTSNPRRSRVAASPRHALWILCGLFAGTVAAAEPDFLAPLDAALQAVVTFEYGKEAAPLDQVEQIVVEAAKHPAQHEIVETKLLSALGSARTRDAKAFLCRELRTIGTVRSIPALEALLSDPDLSHMARYALGRIDDPEAAAALQRALSRTSGQVQAGIIATLGSRRFQPARTAFMRLLESPEAPVAEAAAAALGNLGGAKAMAALLQCRSSAPPLFRQRVDEALLVCAERCLASGPKVAAVGVYEMFYRPDQPRQFRAAGLRGLVAVEGTNAMNRLTGALKDKDPQLRASAVQLCQELPGPSVTRTLAGLLPALAPDTQALLLSALGARGDPAALPAVLDATKSAQEEVRVAAFTALGGLGDASTVPLLVQTAVAAGNEQAAARASLVRLSGEGINPALLRFLPAGDAQVRAAAVRALASRQAVQATAELVKVAQDPDPTVRREAITALGALVDLPQLDALLSLLVGPKDAQDRLLVEQAVATAVERIADREKAAQTILAALANAPFEAKPALLRVLGRTAAPGALVGLRSAVQDSNPAVRDSAVRALADWPDAAASEDLLALASTLSDPTQKVLALRGYIRLASLAKDPAGLYARAMDLAARPEDKKLVLAGLAAANSVAALALVDKYVADAQLQAEAATAAVQIANRVRGTDAARAKASLQKVMAATTDARLRQAAQEVLNELEPLEGHILDWVAAGPYQQTGKDARGLFDAVLPPEGPNAQSVQWTRVTKGIGSWAIDLAEAIVFAEDCAAFLRTRVWSPVAQEARLEMGSDDAIKAWLNGELVHANYVERGAAPRQDRVPIKLKEGWNELMLKIVNRGGGWAAGCRFRKPDGQALEGLKVEAR